MTVRPTDSSHRLQAEQRDDSRVHAAVAEAVGRLRFGVVQLTVHDGRVVQLDVTDRQRFG